MTIIRTTYFVITEGGFRKKSIPGKVMDWIFKQPVIFTWWAVVLVSIVVAFPLMYQSAKNA